METPQWKRFLEERGCHGGLIHVVSRFDGLDLDYVIDIGAHVGCFTIAFSKMYPSAKIFAYEPSSTIFEALEKHVKSSGPVRKLKNIKLIKAGLADGEDHNLELPMKLRGRRAPRVKNNPARLELLVNGADPLSLTRQGKNRLDLLAPRLIIPASNYEQNTEIIKTKTIKQIIKENQIDLNKKIGIKIDCEGSEKYLLNEESTEIMKQMDYINLEVHFKSNCRADSWDDELLPWENYNDWINKNFNDSFEHTYEFGRKHRGWGMFFIKKTK